jgi:RNA polymerase sigma factor (sigma-70 family)
VRSGGATDIVLPGGSEDLAAVPSIGRAARVDRAQAPEADLTRALFEQHATQIFRYCLHQLGSREEAEDAVQSTFLNAFRGIKRGIVPEIESAWLFKIAYNVCLSRRRSTWRRDRVESPTDFDIVEELTPAPSRRADELIGLQDVLEQMPEQQRRAILLREWQGLSYREIGEELELSQAAVETLIFRARRSLAQGLEQPVVVETAKRKRLGAGVLANLVSSAQSFLLGGGAAVKVAAVVAVAGAGTVVATAPVRHHPPIGHAKRPAAPAQSSTAAPAQGGTSGVVVAPVHAGGVPRRAPQQHAARRTVHKSPPAAAPLVSPDSTSANTPAVAPPAVVQPTETPTAPEVQSQPQTPAAAPGRDAAPGQLKKDLSTGTHATPNPASKGKGRDAAPGQQKKDDATSAAPGNNSGKRNAHGRQKASDAGAVAATPSSPVGDPQDTAGPPTDNGNGNGRGGGKDK